MNGQAKCGRKTIGCDEQHVVCVAHNQEIEKQLAALTPDSKKKKNSKNVYKLWSRAGNHLPHDRDGTLLILPCYSIITSTKEVMSLPLFICLSVYCLLLRAEIILACDVDHVM